MLPESSMYVPQASAGRCTQIIQRFHSTRNDPNNAKAMNRKWRAMTASAARMYLTLKILAETLFHRVGRGPHEWREHPPFPAQRDRLAPWLKSENDSLVAKSSKFPWGIALAMCNSLANTASMVMP